MKTIMMCASFALTMCAARFAQAQNFQASYQQAKQYFDSQQYQEAMKLFSSLMVHDERNPYSQYSLFYYALSAKHAGFKRIAKDRFYQIKDRNPRWEQIDEAKLHLSALLFEEGNLLEGFKIIHSIDNRKMSDLIANMKQRALAASDAGEIKELLQNFPKENEVADWLFRKLGNAPEELKEKQRLIDAYKITGAPVKQEKRLPIGNKPVRVAALFPFLLQTLTPAPGNKKNQQVLDLYTGMRMAADSLNKWGTPVELYAYDTQRDSLKILQILQHSEMKQMDIIIGPIFKEGTWMLKNFSSEHQIPLVINPLSNDSAQLADCKYSFLYQPIMETILERAAVLLAKQSPVKHCGIYYGEHRRDSIKAQIFSDQAQMLDISPAFRRRLNVIRSAYIQTDLLTMIDSVTYAMKPDSLAGIYLASDDPLLYIKAINAIEARADKMWLIGDETWITPNTEFINRFAANRVAFSAPNLICITSSRYQDFVKRYVNDIGKAPSFTASTGFECMVILSRLLQRYGRYFQTDADNIENVKGYLNPQGYTYQATRSNGVAPFGRFYQKTGEFVRIDK